jgi:hypothetical protein
MSTVLHRPLPADPLFADVLAELDRLGRSHLLAYNLACGQLLLDRFWGGDAAAFSNKDPGKAQTFGRFVTECADLLSDLGQSAEQLKRAVHAHLVWRGLPATTRDRLLLTHLLELGRCADPTTRAQLALATTTEQWSRQQLRDAVSAYNAGHWYDTDPETPGVQPPQPPPEAPAKPVSAARLVTRTEKFLPVVQQWQAELEQANLQRLTPAQRQRLAAALVDLEARVAVVKGLVG